MDITLEINLSANEQAELCSVLNCLEVELPDRLSALGRAAVREYIEMLQGSTPVRSAENRERRLFLMIREGFGGRIPDEAEVSRIFNITPTSARSLIRTVLSRYRQRLVEPVETAARAILERCGALDNDGYGEVTITNPVLVEALNSMLAQSDGTLNKIVLKKGTGTNYSIQGDSLARLRELLNV